jgi:hypothetical protein
LYCLFVSLYLFYTAYSLKIHIFHHHSNVNNVSKLRLIKADNREIKEIVHNKRKVIEFKEIEKIRHNAREKIKSSVNFKVGKIPAMEFGTTEQRKFFKQLLEYKAVC